MKHAIRPLPFACICVHESIQTTHGYVEADPSTKEQMLAKVTPAGQNAHRFKADDTLLRFLSTLG